ncbi:MAG: hypothetical protein ACLKAK_06390 [Alkaliphilus sp.]
MKKIKIFALILVLAFAAMGGAYAIWQDTLVVEETITTGEVDVRFDRICGSDFGGNYQDFGGDVYSGDPNAFPTVRDALDDGNPNDRKNIGSLDRRLRRLSGNDDDGDGGRTDLLEITLKNGYPSYQEYVDFRIVNIGTVPVKFNLELFEDLDDIIYSTNGIVVNPDGWLIIKFDLVGHYYGPGGVHRKDPISDEIEGYQLNPSESIRVEMVHRIRHNAPEGQTFTFSYRINAVQWNAFEFALPNEI